jgi:hypothetical protein
MNFKFQISNFRFVRFPPDLLLGRNLKLEI